MTVVLEAQAQHPGSWWARGPGAEDARRGSRRHLPDASSTALCVADEPLALGSDVARRVSSLDTLGLVEGSTNGTVADSGGGWSSSEDMLTWPAGGPRLHILGATVAAAAAALNHLHDADPTGEDWGGNGRSRRRT